MRCVIILLWLCGSIGLRAQDCSSLPWEANLTYRANTIESEFVRSLSKGASDALLPLSIGVPVALYAYGMLEVQVPSSANADTWRYSAESGLQTFVTMGVTYGTVVALKHLFDRPRPYQAYPNCIVNYRGDADGSMPSGHAAGSAALATSLILRYPTWGVIVPSVAYALYTGFARLNLGMHYLSDVLVGYSIGVLVAVGVNALNTALFDLAEPILPSSGTYTLNMQGSVPIFSLAVPL